MAFKISIILKILSQGILRIKKMLKSMLKLVIVLNIVCVLAHVDGLASLDIQGDGLARDRLHENLHGCLEKNFSN